MNSSEQKLVQYLSEAHATEQALTRVLQEQIAVTPSGNYRSALQRHLNETRSHADQVRARLDQLGATESPVDAAGVLLQSLLAQAVALAKTPLDLLRGDSGEEKVLKNAKDAAATEALEIATYTAIERLAGDIGDEQTVRIARAIIKEEQRMLDQILVEIPQLTGKVLAAVRGNPSYDLTKTGAGETAQDLAATVKDTADSRIESLIGEEPWPGYDEQTVAEIRKALTRAPASRVRDVTTYERRHKDRAGVLQAAEAQTTPA